MKTIYTAEQLLTSMAVHEDINRFISDCYDKADRIVEEGYNDTRTSLIFHFLDSSRIELYPLDKQISIFCPV